MIVVGGLCLSIACSAVFTLSPMTVYAINTIEYETEYMEPIEESDYLVNQNSRNIFTKIAKKAVKKAINNKARLVNFAEKVAGKTVAKNVNKFFTPITRALKPGQAVYDAIFRAIINAGGSRSVAANVANAVREVLEWTLF